MGGYRTVMVTTDCRKARRGVLLWRRHMPDGDGISPFGGEVKVDGLPCALQSTLAAAVAWRRNASQCCLHAVVGLQLAHTYENWDTRRESSSKAYQYMITGTMRCTKPEHTRSVDIYQVFGELLETILKRGRPCTGGSRLH